MDNKVVKLEKGLYDEREPNDIGLGVSGNLGEQGQHGPGFDPPLMSDGNGHPADGSNPAVPTIVFPPTE